MRARAHTGRGFARGESVVAARQVRYRRNEPELAGTAACFLALSRPTFVRSLVKSTAHAQPPARPPPYSHTVTSPASSDGSGRRIYQFLINARGNGTVSPAAGRLAVAGTAPTLSHIHVGIKPIPNLSFSLFPTWSSCAC